MDIIARMSLATGRFSAFPELADWKTAAGVAMELYLAKEFVEKSGLKELLDDVEKEILKFLFDENQLNLTENVFLPVSKAICGIVEIMLNLLGINTGGLTDACGTSLAKLAENGIRSLVGKLFDKIQAEIVMRLSDIIRVAIVERIENRIYTGLLDNDLLTEVELGFQAITALDDARVNSLLFNGVSLDDPSMPLKNATIGASIRTRPFTFRDLVGYRHDVDFAYGEFATHSTLIVDEPEVLLAGNPLDPENGDVDANAGVGTRFDLWISNVLRYSGSTAYQEAGVFARSRCPWQYERLDSGWESEPCRVLDRLAAPCLRERRVGRASRTRRTVDSRRGYWRPGVRHHGRCHHAARCDCQWPRDLHRHSGGVAEPVIARRWRGAVRQ